MYLYETVDIIGNELMFVSSVLLRVNVNICVFIAFNSILEIDDGMGWIGSLAFIIVFSKLKLP